MSRKAKCPKNRNVQKDEMSKRTNCPKTRKGFKERKADLASYSFTEPVVRVSDTAKEESGLRHKIKPSQDAGTKAHFVVFHKREDKSKETDLIGTRSLNAWKKSAGRGKSWGNCRRLKVTRDDLEVLAYRKYHPVSFGWRFSTNKMPSSFVRSHGLHVNKQSNLRKRRLSNIPTVKDLDEEYSQHWPLPIDFPLKRLHERQGIQYQDAVKALPGRFIRLTISCETVNLRSEVFLDQIELTIRQLRLFGNEARPSATTLQGLVVLSLLRNESHADVYLVQDPNNLSKCYHAHAFLSDGLSRNWPTFLRRKMDRLRRSNGFHAETVQLGRKIIVMKADSKADEVFQINDMEREFPPLPGTSESASFKQNLGLIGRFLALTVNILELKPYKTPEKKNRLSYAAVGIGKKSSKQPKTSNHRAYKAWEDRSLNRSKRPDKHDKTLKHDAKLSRREKQLQDFTHMVDPLVYQKNIGNIHLANRFAILSND